MDQPKPRRKWLLPSVIVVVILGIPIAAWAAASFADVPESHPFYDEIEAIKAAGITTGSTECAPPVTPAYCPESSVRRDAMAAFMYRGFGRILSSEAFESEDLRAVAIGGTESSLIRLTGMAAGAKASGNGYVHVTATGYASESVSCPCLLVLEIVDGLGNSKVWPVLVGAGEVAKPFSFQTVVPWPADTAQLIGLVGQLAFAGTGDEVTVVADLVATYLPFDHTGANTTGDGAVTSLPGSVSDLPMDGIDASVLSSLQEMGISADLLDR
jgi:hypothetical protein